IVIAIVLALLGLTLFKIGLVTGLNPLGNEVGSKATMAFAPGGGLYGYGFGKVGVLLFAFVVGYGASLAEPALMSLGITVEEVTAGAFKKFLVMHSVGVGLGVGLIIGVARILFGWSSLSIMLPSYLVALVLTMMSDEKYVNIGWDSGGVTTGDITSPILIALGLGVAAAVGGAEGVLLLRVADPPGPRPRLLRQQAHAGRALGAELGGFHGRQQEPCAEDDHRHRPARQGGRGRERRHQGRRARGHRRVRARAGHARAPGPAGRRHPAREGDHPGHPRGVALRAGAEGDGPRRQPRQGRGRLRVRGARREGGRLRRGARGAGRETGREGGRG